MRLHFLPLSLFTLLLAGCQTTVDNDNGATSGGKGGTPEETEHSVECGTPPSLPAEQDEPNGIHSFQSEGELDDYFAGIDATLAEYEAKYAAYTAKCYRSGGDGNADAGTVSPGSSESAPSSNDADDANEDITNNQENGVDEGGIVKNVGGALVVLRQGRLYVVDVADQKPPTLVDSMRVARTEALNTSVWYDEMLVKGNLIYVVGYRYGLVGNARGATEIDSFRLTNGKLERLRSMFLESNDYYSGSNYASRLVDGKLVFYMPHFIGRSNGKLQYPRMLEAGDSAQFTDIGPIFGARDVFTSLTKSWSPTFHTVVQCTLPESGDLDCHGRSVIGSWWRETYVSSDATYLWSGKHVYRFDFATLGITAHSASGSPLNQFSFRQGSDSLFVATSTNDGAVLHKMPLAAFDEAGKQPQTLLPIDKGWIGTNRFVGDVFVASLTTDGKNTLVSLDPTTGKTARADLPSSVVRIEPLDERRALVVLGGYGTPDLKLRTVGVDDVATTLGEITLDGLREGEGRSHGFFYKPTGDGAGTFGYAVLNPPGQSASYGWGNGISNIGFFGVVKSGALSSLGIVSAGDVKGTCETSCVDWYGNTRPIFLGDRVFALMGSELAEVALWPSVKKGAAATLE